ncbi:MAG: ABC transporter ATP-binding protein [Bacilli bacterium]
MISIELHNINKVYYKYQSNVYGVENININICSNSFNVFIGPSGAGKSTLINIISLLDTYDSGNYIFNGIDINTLNDKAKENLRQNMFSLVVQDFLIYEELTVDEYLSFGEVINDEIKKNNLLNKLGLINFLNKKCCTLSGGQKEKIALCKALLSKAPILIADEPTSNLDEESSTIIFNLLREEAKEKIVIVVTHDLNKIKESDNVYELKNGHIKCLNYKSIPYKEVNNKEKILVPKKINLFALNKIIFGKNKINKFLFCIVNILFFILLNVSFSFISFNSNIAIYKDAKRNNELTNVEVVRNDDISDILQYDDLQLKPYIYINANYTNGYKSQNIYCKLLSKSSYDTNVKLNNNEIGVSDYLYNKIQEYNTSNILIGENSYKIVRYYDSYTSLSDPYLQNYFNQNYNNIIVMNDKNNNLIDNNNFDGILIDLSIKKLNKLSKVSCKVSTYNSENILNVKKITNSMKIYFHIFNLVIVFVQLSLFYFDYQNLFQNNRSNLGMLRIKDIKNNKLMFNLFLPNLFNFLLGYVCSFVLSYFFLNFINDLFIGSPFIYNSSYLTLILILFYFLLVYVYLLINLRELKGTKIIKWIKK